MPANHENQCTEECVRTETLILRFVAADSRTTQTWCAATTLRSRKSLFADARYASPRKAYTLRAGIQRRPDPRLQGVVTLSLNLHAPKDHHHIEILQRRALRAGSEDGSLSG